MLITHRAVLSAGMALCFSLIAAPPRQALAQGGSTGMIFGSVYDQTGAPITGVRVTARSETQIGGVKSAYTNDEGYFRFPGLLPGTFEVSASAPKLKSVLQKGVRVGINAPVDVTLVMEVETAVEEVKVVEKAPIVSTTSAAVKETYDDDFIDNLPVDIRTAVESFVGNNTAGATSQGGRTMRMRGGGTEQNSFMVEGFHLNGQKVLMNSLAALEVQTAGYGAEYANVPGGVVNMVSKSGSNKYEFEASGYVEDTNLRFFKDAADGDLRTWVYMVNPTFSGPILKDRLWFYLNAEARSEGRDPAPDISGLNLTGDAVTRSYISLRPTLKLTWQVTPRNKLSSYSSLSRVFVRNDASATQNERDAQRQRNDLFYFTGLIWEALLLDNVFLKSQVGVQRFWSEMKPQRCLTDAENCDHIPQVRQTFPQNLFLQNYHEHYQDIEEAAEIINTLEGYFSTKLMGEHALKLKSRIYIRSFERADSITGDGWEQFNGTTPDRQRTYYSNDPRLEDARYGWFIRGSTGTTLLHSVSDSVRITRYLTLNLGGALTQAKANAVGGKGELDFTAVTPSLAVAWDATHDGRTALRASYSEYVDTDVARISRHVNGGQVYRECRWNGTTAAFDNCVYGGGTSGRTLGLPCGPTGIDSQGKPCREALKIPRTWEYTAGAEREILQGVGLGSDVVYRLYTNPYETFETNRIWNPSGSALDPNGSFKNGQAQTVSDLGTPGAARRKYLGLTTTLKKREGALKASASYTWAQLQGNVNDNEGNEFGENPGRDLYLYGYLPDDSRHTFRVAMTYQVAKWLSTGFIYRYYSGRPYQRRLRNDVLGNATDYRARIGTDPGGNINDPGDDRALRLPDLQQVNLQARLNLRPLTGVNGDLFVDVLNLFALRTTTRVVQEDGPAWGQPDRRMDPLTVRLGFRLRI